MIHVVWNEAENAQIWKEGRDSYTVYLFEILDYLGLSYEKWQHDEWSRRMPSGLTIVMGGTNLESWASSCVAYCEKGNVLLAIGGLYGLEDVLGAISSETIKEGWIQWGSTSPADGLQSSFHFFEAVGIEISDPLMQCWGTIIHRNGTPRRNPVITLRQLGKGYAALFGIDLMKTFCMIQQGVSVIRDGYPSYDGTAPIDDGILKTDDACVLDWVRDRNALEPAGTPFYLHPIVDEWRILFMRVLSDLMHRIEHPFAQVWFWPDGLTGIAHISPDTDGNSPTQALRTLERLKEAEIRSTWCVIMPGYGPEISAKIAAEGHEIALHYNALGTELPQGQWSERDYKQQLDKLKNQFPQHKIITNKNHYLRWEGDVQFYQWCERAGIVVEQSKGGSKQGNKGFLAGTSHPYVPISTAGEHNRLFNLVSLPTLAWDPPIPFRCTAEEAKALLDRSFDVYGIAHFLFHPAMLDPSDDNDKVGAMLVDLVRYGRNRGMAWWTGAEIWHWLEIRRQIKVDVTAASEHSIDFIVTSAVAVQKVTLLLAAPKAVVGLSVESESHVQVHSLRTVERFGCPSIELVADIQAGHTAFSVKRTS